MRLFRLVNILAVSIRFGLDEFIFGHARFPIIETLLRTLLFWRRFNTPRAVRLRLALEKLGPIFVKFGQIISTRRDLIPPDIADELAKLQDQVPPFSSDEVREVIRQTYGKDVNEVFAEFDIIPIASASVAQVHFATLPHPCPPPPAGEGDAGSREFPIDGTPVAVKILRPGIEKVIVKDLALMDAAAWALEKLWADGARLRPREVVAEFAAHVHEELDLMLEAANCSQLHRNFADGRLLLVPEVYWDFCFEKVMVMQRMDGIPISHVDKLREAGISIPQLARDGVEIFFTQVFRDGFFHADMHPGNIQVARNGKYVALDFGIMGSLNDTDKHYLARNFLGFFRRDYKEVAAAHIESGWVPAGTSPEAFENAIRAVCEPIFDKPLKDISFGRVLLRLFQTSRRFGMEIQPQLVMLQKTLLNIEGLGRDLDPNLDLWDTGKPYLERWMSEQLGWRSVLEIIKEEAPLWGKILPQLPRLIHEKLRQDTSVQLAPLQLQLAEQAKMQRWLMRGVIIAIGLLGLVLLKLFLL